MFPVCVCLGSEGDAGLSAPLGMGQSDSLRFFLCFQKQDTQLLTGSSETGGLLRQRLCDRTVSLFCGELLLALVFREVSGWFRVPERYYTVGYLGLCLDSSFWAKSEVDSSTCGLQRPLL